MFSLVWKNIIRKKGQAILSICLTFFTIMVFVMLFAFFYNFQNGLNLSGQRLGADIMVLPVGSDTSGYTTLYTAEPSSLYMPDEVYDKVLTVDGVEAATPQFFVQTLDAGCCSVDTITRIVGFDNESDFVLKPWMEQAGIAELKENEVIVGNNNSDYLGDQMGLLGSIFKVVDTMSPTGTGMDDTYFINIDTARHLASTNENLREVIGDIDAESVYSSVLIKVAEGYDIATVVDNINNLNLNVEVISVANTISQMRSQFYSIGRIIFFIWLALLLVTILALVGRFTSLAEVRKKEMGILRAIGGQKSDVFKTIITESCILSAAGGFLGGIVGMSLVVPLVEWLKTVFAFNMLNISLGFAAAVIVLGTIVSIILGGLSGLYPAWKVSVLDPQEVITKGDMD